MPGNDTPLTSNGQALDGVRQCNPFMNQTDGIEMPRWGSFASSAVPVSLFDGATTQLFDPTWWSPAIPRPASSPASSRIRPPVAATFRQAAASAGVGEAAAAVAEAERPVASFVVADAAADGTITGIESQYAGNIASVNAGSPSCSSASIRKTSVSKFPPSCQAWTFCQASESIAVHGSTS